MRIDRPAERAAWPLGIDRHGGAAALDRADNFAILAGAPAHRRHARIGQIVKIVTVAVSPAGADRQSAGGMRGAERRNQTASRSDRARGPTQTSDHEAPPPRMRER